jgi:hypothetical protein
VQPAQRVEQVGVRLVGVARGVGVLDPEDERAVVVPRERPVEQCRPHQADVRVAGRRRAEAAPDRCQARDTTGLVSVPMPVDR